MTSTGGSRTIGIAHENELGEALNALLPRDRSVTTSIFDRVTAAPDASHYLMTPRAVVTPRDADELAQLLTASADHGISLTFRSGGTSLSGQATSGEVLVDTRTYFRRITILEEGARVRVKPGVTIRQINARLLRHGRKLGPDPASEIACTIGGVIANNSSGMACGTTENSYRTLESAVIVLASGTVVDTAAPDADRLLHAAEPALWNKILELRTRILDSPVLRAEVERQHRIKNTMGYGLNSLLDFERAVDILLHLMVGSEGTLGFIAEATLRTVSLRPHAATNFLVFSSLREATDALPALVASQATAIELLDAASLRVVQQDPTSQGALPDLTYTTHAALLVEYQADDASTLAELIATGTRVIESLNTIDSSPLSSNAAHRAALWHLRKGLYAQVAGARPSGTTALLEDIAVPVERLSKVCADLIDLFDIHGYEEAVIFGHAKDGNIHFLVTENFDDPQSLQRYRVFTEQMVDLILEAGGTLKAEHGTGRIMAPFVRRQYGDELFTVMREIKAAFDPRRVLNPDSVITEDPDLHLRHLKSTPKIEEEADRCVECGYCEPVCPSADLTLTPRQRIVARRAIVEAEAAGDTALVAELEKAQGYEVVETCAVDGMCETACPVSINTGDLVRRLRAESATGGDKALWRTLATVWKPVTEGAAVALNITAALPAPLVLGPNHVARSALGSDRIPLWSPDMPSGGTRRTRGQLAPSPDAQIVYFAACIGTMFGPAPASSGVAQSFVSLAEKAGVSLTRPRNIGGLCCGTPWKSKGMTSGYLSMIDRTVSALWTASRAGALPVVCDNSSCSEGLVIAVKDAITRTPAYASLRIIDAVDYAAEHFLPYLDIDGDARIDRLVVHPTCSSTRAGSNPHLMELAGAVAVEAEVPDDWGCCGFAGDRGLLHPELTRSATAREAASVQAGGYSAHASCNRTCEIGLTRATGQEYRHILELLDDVATPKATASHTEA